MGIYIKGVRDMTIVKAPRSNILFDVREDYYTDPVVIREVWKENVYEVFDTRFAVSGVTIDIGANIGAFSLLAAYHGSRVIAVEPEPHNLRALEKNIALNNMSHMITVVPVGISDHRGTAVIGDDGGGATIKDDLSVSQGSTIDLITLDDLFDKYNVDKVNVLKIDVEGSELEIITGASRETLEKCAYVTMEFDVRSGAHMGDMVKKLSETHHVRTMGRWTHGGMIWAWLY